ncbi:MAG TPA: DNA polymerase I [Dehalococcoidia bacterium]|nr:DNA polymerase I [Dehalococcoidia bacterium]
MNAPAKPRLLLIDGHGIIHRSFHALKDAPLTVRRTGEVVTAVYGLASTLLSVMQELKPTHVIVALDKGKDTFRHKISKEYKATRVAMPDDLRAQLDRCREVIEAFGFPVYEDEEYEADDLLGALSSQAAEQGVETYLVSLDSDIAQLVRPGVRLWMYRPYQRDSVVYESAEDVKKRYGVLPEQMPDLKALKGDVSDNIAGVPGVGDKTAARLIEEFGSIEKLYERIEDVNPPKLRETLKAHEAQVRQGKHLATIAHEAPAKLDLDAAELAAHYDREHVLALFRDLEFRSLIERLPEGAAVAGAPAAAAGPKVEERYTVVGTQRELESLVQRLTKAGRFAFACEAVGQVAMTARLLGLSFAPAPGEAYYVPLNGGEPLGRLGPLLEDEKLEKTGHNLKFAQVALARHGLWPRGLAFDAMIASFLLGEGGGARPGEGSLSLRWLVSRRLGVEMAERDATGGRRRGAQLAMDVGDPEPATLAPFACAEADMAGRLRPVLEPELERQGMTRLFREIEMPLLSVLARMELNGVAIDVGALRELSATLAEEISRFEGEIYKSVGHEFNIGSPQQLSHVLFEELHLPKTRRLKTGAYTTDAQALEGLRGLHDVIELIYSYRELTKLKSTYLDSLPALVNPETNRLHTEFNQAGAATGRLSSSNPNLQNIPVRTALGEEVRRAFVARDVGPDPHLLSADYSQIELRIMAHITDDPALVEAFRRDEDIHAATASQVFGVPLAEVTPLMRRRAKVFNFGVLYGLSEYGLSVREKIPREEAATFIRTYFEKYPGIKRYVEETVQETRRLGYAETLFGRRRYIPEINSGNFNVRQAAERAAINMPVQGTAADIIKIAMNRIQDELERRKLRSLMTLQVHDELIFECPGDELEEVRALAVDIMPKSLEMKVPMKIDTKVGRNWGEMEYGEPTGVEEMAG